MNKYTSIPKRPLSEYEKQALEYIRQNPGVTAEDVVNFLCPYPDETAIRTDASNAVWYVIWNDYADRDSTTGALKYRTDSAGQ
jgi:hypothetical protein